MSFILASFFLLPLPFSRPLADYALIVLLVGAPGGVGVAAGIVIMWSDWHKGRWSLIAIGLATLFLAASLTMGALLWLNLYYAPFALILMALAVLNMYKWKIGYGAWDR